MEDILLFSLSIKSSIQNYDVFFTQSAYQALNDELNPGDVILVDKNAFYYLNDDMKQIITAKKHIFIEATESQKSYTALEPIIEQLIESKFRKNDRLICIGGGSSSFLRIYERLFMSCR